VDKESGRRAGEKLYDMIDDDMGTYWVQIWA